jgi:hypothetical protein
MAVKKTPYIRLAGTLSGVPFGTSLPDGKYVYQSVAPGLGNVEWDDTRTLQCRAHVVPTNPQTEAQQANRAKFAQALAAWQALSIEQRAAWQKIASRAGRRAYDIFMSDWLEKN